MTRKLDEIRQIHVLELLEVALRVNKFFRESQLIKQETEEAEEAKRSKPVVKIEVIHFKIVAVLFDPIIKVVDESCVIISRS